MHPGAASFGASTVTEESKPIPLSEIRGGLVAVPVSVGSVGSKIPPAPFSAILDMGTTFTVVSESTVLQQIPADQIKETSISGVGIVLLVYFQKKKIITMAALVFDSLPRLVLAIRQVGVDGNPVPMKITRADIGIHCESAQAEVDDTIKFQVRRAQKNRRCLR